MVGTYPRYALLDLLLLLLRIGPKHTHVWRALYRSDTASSRLAPRSGIEALTCSHPPPRVRPAPHRTARRLHGLTAQSLLVLYLQAGAAALNTPRTAPDTAGFSADDPLCQKEYLAIARGLPFSKHIHSSWVCPITKALMDENNPPVVLPNGYVYSRGAMEEMAARNDGKVVCAKTGDGPYELAQLQKVFLA